MPTPLASSDPLPSSLKSLYCLDPSLPDGLRLHPPATRSLLSDALRTQPPYSHSPLADDLRLHPLSPPSSLNFVPLPPDGLLIQHDFLASRFRSEVTAFQTRHSTSLSCPYYWTSLACSNPRYSWVTYSILSNFCNFSQLVLPTHPLLFYQFLSPYQSFVLLSNACQFLTRCYLFTFYVIWQLINAPAVHTKSTTLALVLSCARSLRQYTFLTSQVSLAVVPFWLWGDRTVAGGFLIEQTDMF